MIFRGCAGGWGGSDANGAWVWNGVWVSDDVGERVGVGRKSESNWGGWGAVGGSAVG